MALAPERGPGETDQEHEWINQSGQGRDAPKISDKVEEGEGREKTLTEQKQKVEKVHFNGLGSSERRQPRESVKRK